MPVLLRDVARWKSCRTNAGALRNWMARANGQRHRAATGNNALDVIDNAKARSTPSRSLPEGVEIVTVYDRSA